MSRAALAAIVVVLSGCETPPDVPPCEAGMPTASQLRTDPSFAELKYHAYQPSGAVRPVAHDIWADAKFEYGSAIEYAVVKRADAKSIGDDCAFAVSLRFLYPGRDVDRRKLKVFTQALAPAVGVDAGALDAAMLDTAASGDKYRARAIGAGGSKVAIEAGRLFHPTRGEFFMMTATWPKPVGEGGK